MPRHLEEGPLPGKGHTLRPPCRPLLEPCLLRSPAVPRLQDSPDAAVLCPQQHWPANCSYLDTLGLKRLAFKIPSPHPHCTLCPWGLPSLATSQSSVSVQPPLSSFLGAPWGAPLLASPCAPCPLLAHF